VSRSQVKYGKVSATANSGRHPKKPRISSTAAEGKLICEIFVFHPHNKGEPAREKKIRYIPMKKLKPKVFGKY
jgi:hypothetical protein